MQPRSLFTCVWMIFTFTIASGCGSSSHDDDPSPQGGAAATGGATAVGGLATGGVSTGGAVTGTGGANTSGGTSTGGVMATGGTSTSGGMSTGGLMATGGSTNTGGVTATGGNPNTGGVIATGGTPTTGGAAGNMRDIPSSQVVEEMHVGWNLGNTLDADPDETAWGNPMTTQAMMNAVQAAGFGTVRIPVTWMHHMGGSPNYTVENAWMDRVEQVANYVLSAGMYAIINSHHDEWVSLMPGQDHAAIAQRIGLLWTQIATRFRDYGDHLVFETLNEPRTRDGTQWTGGTPEARAILNTYNLAAVNAIRATGGNNTLRHVMVPTHAANASDTSIGDLVIPNNDPKIIVSLHTYYPYEVSFGESADWGSNADRSEMAAELDRIHDLLPARGRAVVIGEWGTVNQNNTSVRADHAETYARLVRERGMCPIWWDNGGTNTGADGFGLLGRDDSPPTWVFPSIVTGLVNGANVGAGL